jgi:hypothetical protein
MINRKINLFNFIVDNRHKLPKVEYIEDGVIHCGKLMFIQIDNHVILDINSWFSIGEPYVFNAEYTQEACHYILDMINIINMVASAINGDYLLYVLRDHMTPVCINHESDLSTAIQLSLSGGGYLPVIVTTGKDFRKNSWVGNVDTIVRHIKERYGYNTYYPRNHLKLSCYSKEAVYYELASPRFLINDNVDDGKPIF